MVDGRLSSRAYKVVIYIRSDKSFSWAQTRCHRKSGSWHQYYTKCEEIAMSWWDRAKERSIPVEIRLGEFGL